MQIIGTKNLQKSFPDISIKQSQDYMAKKLKAIGSPITIQIKNHLEYFLYFIFTINL